MFLPKIRTGISGILMVVVLIGFFAYHIWTVVIAFNYGIVWGVLSFFLPIVSEMLVNGFIIAEVGLLNIYTLAFVALGIFYGLASIISPKDTKEE